MSHKSCLASRVPLQSAAPAGPREMASITNPSDTNACQTQEGGPCAPAGKGGPPPTPSPGSGLPETASPPSPTVCAYLGLFLHFLLLLTPPFPSLSSSSSCPSEFPLSCDLTSPEHPSAWVCCSYPTLLVHSTPAPCPISPFLVFSLSHLFMCLLPMSAPSVALLLVGYACQI